MHLISLLQSFVGLLMLLNGVLAQVGPFDPTGFNFVGRIEDMTLDTAGGVLAGGTITVNGIKVTVPKNLLVTAPSVNVAWSELFKASGAPNLPQFGTVSWNVNIYGNLVKNQYIAGLIYIAQDAFQLLQGYISSIDTATGHFTVGANSAAPINSGFKLVLNDPLGIFGRNYTDNPVWTVDPENPSIRSATGFPLCIPRSSTDPLCPSSNRPKDASGKPQTTFTFGDPATLSPGAPDPRIMVPLAVGDFVTFSGTDVGGGLIAVYSLLANLGIFTAPGTKPSYVTCETVQYAIVDNQGGEIAETRAVAYTTDPTTAIQWFSEDVDSCTGSVTERNIQLVQPFTAAPAGKTVFRLGKTDVSPVPRNAGFRSQTGTMAGPQGIIAGQFIQPVFENIFPELIDFGSRPLINSFDVIPYLTKGSGPFVPGNLLSPPPTTTSIVGQLSPWPGATAPSTTSCTPIPSTSASSSASSSSPSTSPTPIPDSVTITTITSGKNQGGITPVTVVAKSTNTSGSAKLTLTITGNVNSGPTQMNNDGGGNYSLTISVKGPKTATVNSDGGGTATGAVP